MGEICVIELPEILVKFLEEKARQEIIEETGKFVVLKSAEEENKKYIESLNLKKKGGKR